MSSLIQLALYKVKRPFHFIKTGILKGLPAQIKYRFPAKNLTIYTITGTDGKTTSSTILYHVLKAQGHKVALLTTVAAYMGNKEIDTGFHVTSPQPQDLQKFMREMVDKGFTHLILEVTSHGIYQYRIWGVTPTVVGLTNISAEHLDYHVNYDEYLAAKAELLRLADTVVLNADDVSFHRVKKYLSIDTDIKQYSEEMKLPNKVAKTIKGRFPEKYNQQNARLVYMIAQQAGVSDENYISGIQKFPGIPGRMQFIKTNKRFDIVVDFAHTPQGLESALTALRDYMKKNKKSGRLIAVYGSAGLRDRSKRPKMGEIGVRLADIVILTAEDPRTEDVWSILRQMKEGLTEGHDTVLSIADRGEAIRFALQELAKPGDVVGVFGKGHEKSMCFGTTEQPWNDTEAILERAK
ncbi:MAG: UDP-N-acetylmuramyl-tripeptide synthetase [Candidatus Pacebacteria bacterium]|nr:UDP-N-acetylmuramyl-tripeptide synthetase [Candidatus Paceibacterota bacterium]PIR63791.1 MAG: hypothetical protein COU64_02350 [Candidatus Pacebacteria bacterium CG10_big_fil_rev_8_21_14_0_10_40_26]PIZ78577.1 MAG: hypothetical protein COY01_05035 [Candidatus Pacebacteria bacterium CG_4_10_14_0_2_um_filter_40_20]PJA69428.1 MAG: hypothetical protein CO156_00925 [Candidatus Pacebacteria bacterium CG_4_9_14_3_um_filter_40_12]PJC41445.1 MAG: hypothetical protein CO041_04910 [Candidatus Pacebacte